MEKKKNREGREGKYSEKKNMLLAEEKEKRRRKRRKILGEGKYMVGEGEGKRREIFGEGKYLFSRGEGKELEEENIWSTWRRKINGDTDQPTNHPTGRI